MSIKIFLVLIAGLLFSNSADAQWGTILPAAAAGGLVCNYPGDAGCATFTRFVGWSAMTTAIAGEGSTCSESSAVNPCIAQIHFGGSAVCDLTGATTPGGGVTANCTGTGTNGQSLATFCGAGCAGYAGANIVFFNQVNPSTLAALANISGTSTITPVVSCINTHPCMQGFGSSGASAYLATSGNFAASATFSTVSVASRPATGGSCETLVEDPTFAADYNEFGYSPSVDGVRLIGHASGTTTFQTDTNATAASGAHTLFGIMNGASSLIRVDNHADTTGTTVTGGVPNALLSALYVDTGSTCNLGVSGFSDGAIWTAAQRQAIYLGLKAQWGTP